MSMTIVGQRVQRIIMASRNSQPLDTVLQDIDADPSAPNRKNYSEYVKPVLVLICYWLGTHSLLTAFPISNCDVEGYQVNFMRHSKELHFKF